MHHPYPHQLFIVRHRGAPCYVTDTAAIYTKQVLPSKAPKAESSAVLGNSYPNPTTSQATIPYALPNKVEQASIELRESVTGRLVGSYNLPAQAGQAQLEVALDMLVSGNYVYTLMVDNASMGTGKMVVIK